MSHRITIRILLAAILIISVIAFIYYRYPSLRPEKASSAFDVIYSLQLEIRGYCSRGTAFTNHELPYSDLGPEHAIYALLEGRWKGHGRPPFDFDHENRTLVNSSVHYANKKRLSVIGHEILLLYEENDVIWAGTGYRGDDGLVFKIYKIEGSDRASPNEFLGEDVSHLQDNPSLKVTEVFEL